MPTLDQAIRERAYHLWLNDGQRDGQADAYWLAAQRYVLSASIADPTIAHDGMPRETIAPVEVETKTYPAKKAKAAAAPKKSKRRAA